MVFLVAPNSKVKCYGLTAHNYSAIQPNIYMGILQSYLSNCMGISCGMINLEAEGLGNEDGAKVVLKTNPSTIGVICSGSNPSASTMTMTGAIEFCQAVRKISKEVRIFLWGGHPNVLKERSLAETGANYVVPNDGINTDLDNIPMVDWDEISPLKYKAHNWHCFGDIDNRSPYGVVYTSLGCPYGCKFCCVNNLFGKRMYRKRSMRKVVDEIGYLVERFGVKHIKIMDELFVIKDPRIDEFCDLMKERKYDVNMWCFSRVDTIDERILNRLKEVGMNWIAYGFESINKRIVGNTDKGVSTDIYKDVIGMTRRAGVNIIADVIAGFWEDNEKTLENMYAFLCENNFEFINLYPLFAYAGTPLYDEMIASGTMHEPFSWDDYSLYGYECRPCQTQYLSSKDVLKWRDEKYCEYFKRKEYQDMILKKFGDRTLQHVQGMADKPLKRRLYDDFSSCSSVD